MRICGMAQAPVSVVVCVTADFLEHRVNVLDGRNRMLPSINGRVPGPTIEVNHGTLSATHAFHRSSLGGSSGMSQTAFASKQRSSHV